MSTRRPLIAGNWKMNGLKVESRALASELATNMRQAGDTAFDLLICPPFTALSTAAEALKGSSVLLGGQDCHTAKSGAHTGDISPLMLKDLGCSFVILGHSERRADHGETNALVQAKAMAALEHGLNVIICVGETEAERDADQTLVVVAEQLAGSLPQGAVAERVVIAYEPVWAIGTGKTPTTQDVAQVHAALRWEIARHLGGKEAEGMRLLYGGSVKPSNATELMGLEDVDGALVGGASLVAADFWAIASAVA